MGGAADGGGQILVKNGQDTGRMLVNMVQSTGQIVVKYASHCSAGSLVGPTRVRHWSSTGQIVVKDGSPELVGYWLDTGQVVVKRWSTPQGRVPGLHVPPAGGCRAPGYGEREEEEVTKGEAGGSEGREEKCAKEQGRQERK